MNGHTAEVATITHSQHWTREGFNGTGTYLARPHALPSYLGVDGPHAPHRLQIGDLALPDRDDPAALPLPFLVARSGLQLSASARRAPMPFVVCNVEADEMHFVQEGVLEYETDYGSLTAGSGDLVCVPRAVQYRVRPLQTPTLSLIAEVPGALALDPPGEPPVLERPTLDAPLPPGGETLLLLKSFDGITRYRKPHDPLATVALQEGIAPVWKLHLPTNLAACGGPPRHFVTSPGQDALFYNLSARSGRRRPPIHSNADYDELIYFVAGPGTYGRVDQPGTLTWVPKGVAHQGPTEDVPEGYVAWMLESRSTLRLTPAGHAVAELMEVDQYGRQPAG